MPFYHPHNLSGVKQVVEHREASAPDDSLDQISLLQNARQRVASASKRAPIHVPADGKAEVEPGSGVIDLTTFKSPEDAGPYVPATWKRPGSVIDVDAWYDEKEKVELDAAAKKAADAAEVERKLAEKQRQLEEDAKRAAEDAERQRKADAEYEQGLAAEKKKAADDAKEKEAAAQEKKQKAEKLAEEAAHAAEVAKIAKEKAVEDAAMKAAQAKARTKSRSKSPKKDRSESPKTRKGGGASSPRGKGAGAGAAEAVQAAAVGAVGGVKEGAKVVQESLQAVLPNVFSRESPRRSPRFRGRAAATSEPASTYHDFGW